MQDVLAPLTMAALAGLAAHASTRVQPPEEVAARARATARATAAELGKLTGVTVTEERIGPARYDVDELGALERRVEALERERAAAEAGTPPAAEG